MVRVSLIPLVSCETPDLNDRLTAYQTRLEHAGYSVEIERVGSPGPVAPHRRGLVALAVAGVRAASAPYLVVVDLDRGYQPEVLLRVVERLETGKATLVVAARRGHWWGSVARRLLGTTDPTAGLIGLTREAAGAADEAFAPVGSRFVCELLARVPGTRAEVAVGPICPSRPRWSPLDDVRHAKRIADDRLGNLSRLLQFCFVGASGMVVDLTMYAALQALLSRTPLDSRRVFPVRAAGSPISLAVVVAAVLAIATAMTWNFALNRRLTFNDARQGSILRQYRRYALSNLVGIGVSLTFRLLLPSSIAFFARHRLAAALAGIVAATGISFSLSRWFVFEPRPPARFDPPAHRIEQPDLLTSVR